MSSIKSIHDAKSVIISGIKPRMSSDKKGIIYRNIIMEETDESEYDETIMREDSSRSIDTIKREASEHLKFKNMVSRDGKSDYEDEIASGFDKLTDSELTKIKNEWSMENKKSSNLMQSFDSDGERNKFYIEKDDEKEEEDEEETIAMFVTASGQQLALYAVEDSDDYFAVAVYDESGEPPTNFQFLMKSDVERLIKEGAVRTVKKPSQIKKQLVTSQPPVLVSKEDIPGNQSQFLNNQCPERRNQKNTNCSKSIPEVQRNDWESDEEFEQSTVQYILCDQEPSDSELTFDDIQATLQTSKSIDRKFTKKGQSDQKKTRNGLLSGNSTPVRNTSYRGVYYSSKKPEKSVSVPQQENIKRFHISNTCIIGSKPNPDNISTVLEIFPTNSSANITREVNLQKVKRSRKQQLISVNREDSEIIIQPVSELQEERVEPSPRKRGRRKKKSNSLRKSSRRINKKQRSRVEVIELDIDETDLNNRRKEVLEITLDENKDKSSSDKENEVIMVGDSDEEEDESPDESLFNCEICSKMFKQRRSLDAHLRFCSKLRSNKRNLRVRRNRVDFYKENKTRKSSRGSSRESVPDRDGSMKRTTKRKTKGRDFNKAEKEYSCKICSEKFNMVVSLARHVRFEHSSGKKRRSSKFGTGKTVAKVRGGVRKSDDSDEELKRKEVRTRSKTRDELERKKKNEIIKSGIMKMKKFNEKRLKRVLSKDLFCGNCNRWFPSVGALQIHSMRHLTRKSVMKIYRCRICSKLSKSHFIYMKHKKIHVETKKRKLELKKDRNSSKADPKRSEFEKSKEITINRRRGKPRKVKSNI